MLATAVAAADLLAGDGFRARVLSMHTLKPLDVDAVLAAARQTGLVVTLEEHSVIGGLGSAVAEVMAEANIPGVRLRRLGVPSAFGKVVGDQQYLRTLYGLDADSVAARVLPELGTKRGPGLIEGKLRPHRVGWHWQSSALPVSS